MNIFTRSGTMVLVLVVLLLATTQTPGVGSTSVAPNAEPSQPKSKLSNSTFYLVRPDLRKCASPMCGGYFVHQVNSDLTRCANGRQMSECYVSSIDWNGIAEAELEKAMDREIKGGANNSNFTLSEQVVDFAKLNGALVRGSMFTRG